MYLTGLPSFFTVKYKKDEKRKKSRQDPEKENISLDVVQKLLDSTYITDIMANSIQSMRDESSQPTTVSDFTNLRDVLILVPMIKSMRRPMEITEFTLAEYSEMEKRVDPNKKSAVLRQTEFVEHRSGYS